MGGLVSSLGFGSNQGTNWQAQGIPAASPVATPEQINSNYNYAQQGINYDRDLLQALQGQNGIQNQSNVYNQLTGVVNGQGPNPAMAALNQATAANTANQAALMAGQRGSGANTGLIARQAAQQGAANQQAAIGQGATMQAQQSLGALNMQGGLATQQVGQQMAATNAYNQAAQNEQSILNGGYLHQQGINAQMQGNINSANAGINNTIANGQQGLAGSVLGGVGSALGGFFAKGGKVPNYDDGGAVMPSATATPQSPSLNSALNKTVAGDQPQSVVGRFMKGIKAPMASIDGGGAQQGSGAQALAKGASGFLSGVGSVAKGIYNSASMPASQSMAGGAYDAGNQADDTMYAARGGKVPAMVSPGEMYLPPKKAQKVAEGKESPMSGEKIPGKAKVKGDSLKNDTVAKTLESGGIVIPRSVMESEDPAKSAAAFVAAHMAKSKRKLLSKK